MVHNLKVLLGGMFNDNILLNHLLKMKVGGLYPKALPLGAGKWYLAQSGSGREPTFFCFVFPYRFYCIRVGLGYQRFGETGSGHC